MTLPRLLLLVVASSVLACRPGTVPGASGSGIEGRVLRGPVTPVCIPDTPCYAPFAATFLVPRAGVTVATFESDSGGRFLVYVPAGAYAIFAYG
jgi:hypothetical protein